MRGRGEYVVHAAVLVLILAAVFPRVVLMGHTLSPGAALQERLFRHAATPEAPSAYERDMIRAFLVGAPAHAACSEALRKGEWPLWNHLEGGGRPLLAAYTYGMLSPFRLLYAVLGTHEAASLWLLLRLWVCGMTAYLCARTMRLNVAAARFASFGWMLGGLTLAASVSPVADVCAWAPLCFMGVELLFDGHYRRGFCALAAGATLTLLAGPFEMALPAVVLPAVYIGVRVMLERRRRALLPLFGSAAAAVLVALIICAPQIIPAVEFLGHIALTSPRGMPPRFTYSAFPGFWVPRLTQEYQGLYAGGVALLALAPLLTRGPADRARNARIGGLVSCALLCLIPAWSFRWAAYEPQLALAWLVLPMFTLALLGAHGVDTWYARPRRVTESACLVPVLAIGIVMVAAWYAARYPALSGSGLGSETQNRLVTAITLAGLAVLCIASHYAWPRSRVPAVALAATLALELAIAAHGRIPSRPRDDVWPKTALTEYLRGLPGPIRVDTAATVFPPGVLALYGIEEQDPHEGARESLRVASFNRAGPEVTALGSVWAPTHFLADVNAETDTAPWVGSRSIPEAVFDGIAVYRNTAAPPRAFLVGKAKQVADRKSVFVRMADAGYDPRRVALTETPPSAPLPDAVAVHLGAARITGRTPTCLTVSVDTAERAVLVVSETYDPGWTSTVDKDEAEVFPVYGALRGVIVPQGKHTVVMRYRPVRFVIAAYVSTGVLALSLVLSVTFLWKSRRTRSRGRRRSVRYVPDAPDA